MLDLLKSDFFSTTNLTATVNKMPMVPTPLGSSGLFEEEGQTTTTGVIEIMDGKLDMIADSERGTPGDTTTHDKREGVPYRTAHFQRNDSLKADEIQGIRAFGSESDLETVQSRMEMKMAKHTRDLDLTLEHQRTAAISGNVIDKTGKVLFNPFTAFGIAQPAAIDFKLSVGTTKLRDACRKVIEAFEDALEYAGDFQVEAWAGKDFHAEFVQHDNVEKTYANYEAAVNLRGDVRAPFEFGGILWNRSRTRAKAKTANGDAPLIADNEVRFVVRGVPGLYITRFAPADTFETVNTIGLPRYAFMDEQRSNMKALPFEVQSNPISLCTNPAALIRGTRS